MPALKPVAVALVCDEGVHKYVYGVPPPVTVPCALPLLPPWQLTLLTAVAVTTGVEATQVIITCPFPVAAPPVVLV